ncbi:hypothetical protein Sjap_005415 [Stephania japonica]|uniref:Cytochrome P450 n=1 Tax=Stephania japonica TaxID=461633 RepID=A0AAP0K424_9MAGN
MDAQEPFTKNERLHSNVSNEDIATSRSDFGDLLLCNGCPRAFHKDLQSPAAKSSQEISKGPALCPYCTPLYLHLPLQIRRQIYKKFSVKYQLSTLIFDKKYAPEPPGAWPIIGHLPLLVSAKQPHRAFAALAEKYGPAFMLRMGMSPMLIVSSREVAKECYTAKDHVFATRPVTTAGKLMAYDHSVMGFTPFGTYWREIRKIATVELFSARRIGMLKPVRQSEVSLWMKGLHEKWVHNGKSSVSVELKSRLEELTFNLLMQMVAGKRYYGVTSPRRTRRWRDFSATPCNNLTII